MSTQPMSQNHKNDNSYKPNLEKQQQSSRQILEQSSDKQQKNSINDSINHSEEWINLEEEEIYNLNNPSDNIKQCQWKKSIWYTVRIIAVISVLVIILPNSNTDDSIDANQSINKNIGENTSSSQKNDPQTTYDFEINKHPPKNNTEIKNIDIQDDNQTQTYPAPDPSEQTYDLVKLNSTSARCLDGSPAAYYVSQTGDPSKLFLMFQGGSWCLGDDQQQTLQSCYYRSKSPLGSSNYHSQQKIFNSGVLSNKQQNYFKDWKKVFILYCDGSGHQGTRKQSIQYNNDTKLYFRGHNNTIQIFDDLQQQLGLYTSADKVVLSGESAGAVAMYMWANYLNQKIKKGKLYAIADAGIFYHPEGNTHTVKLKQKYANLMNITNEQIDPPVPQCIKKFQNQKQNCMLVQNLVSYIQVPLFHVQSVYDLWSLTNIWQVGCLWKGQQGMLECSEEESESIEDHRENVLDVLMKIAEQPQNGVWGVSCFVHAIMLYWSYTSQNYQVPAGSNFTVAKSIEQWMEQPEQNNIHIDDQPWSTNTTCS